MMGLPKTLPIYQNHNFIILGPYLDGKNFCANISLMGKLIEKKLMLLF
jgi:hypothetical protein